MCYHMMTSIAWFVVLVIQAQPNTGEFINHYISCDSVIITDISFFKIKCNYSPLLPEQCELS